MQTESQLRHKIWTPIPLKMRKVEDVNSMVKAIVVQKHNESPFSCQSNHRFLDSFNSHNSAFRYIFTDSHQNLLKLTPSRYSHSDAVSVSTTGSIPSDKSLPDKYSSVFYRKAPKLFLHADSEPMMDKQQRTPTFRLNSKPLKELSMNQTFFQPEPSKKPQEIHSQSFFSELYTKLFSDLCFNHDSASETSECKKDTSTHQCEHHEHHHDNENGNAKLANLLKLNLSKEKTRHCNCKNSRCLKLYCECLAYGEVCDDRCNCCDCHNNVQNEETRAHALSLIMGKKPEVLEGSAQQKQSVSKIVRGKGCHCKKSGCSKKYCECYNAGGGCGPHCKCEGCKNPLNKEESPKSAKTSDLDSPISQIVTQGLGLNFMPSSVVEPKLLANQIKDRSHSLICRELSKAPTNPVSILSLVSL